MRTFSFIACTASLLLCLSSCVKEKDLIAKPITTAAADTSFSTLKVADNFNWSTTNQIKFHFTGSGQDEYQLVLRVSLPDGSVLFQKLQNATEDFESVLEIPAHVSSVTVSYGSVTKTLDCIGGTVTMTIN